IDRAEESLTAAMSHLRASSSVDRVAGMCADVTMEERMSEAFRACTLEFGGLDILVANAGLAASAPIEQTSLGQWRETFAVLGDGYFLAAREAFRVMRKQGGGSIV